MLLQSFLIVALTCLQVISKPLPTASLETLRNDALIGRIIDDHLLDNERDVKTLRVVSTRMNSKLAQGDVTQFSVLGSDQYIFGDLTFCNLIQHQPAMLRSVRAMYVTLGLYRRCRLNAQSLPSLRHLLVYVQGDEPVDNPYAQQGETHDHIPSIIVRTWMQLHQDFDRQLTRLEVIDTGDKSVLHHVLMDSRLTDKMDMLATAVKSDLVNVNQRSTNDLTPLHACFSAAFYPFDEGNIYPVEQCARILVEKGADPNAFDVAGYAPIHYAALLSHSATIAVLHQHNGNINLQDPHLAFADTPLILAVEKHAGLICFTELAETLYHHPDVVENAYNMRVCEMVTQHLIDQERQAEYRMSPSQYLLQNRADLTLLVNNLSTLSHLIRNNRVDLIRLVLLHYPEEARPFRVPDPSGRTPFDLAQNLRHQTILRLLTQHNI